MNLRPSGYEPDELPGCSTPRCVWCVLREEVLIRSGGDLLSRVLGRSTISGGALNFRVRDGIGCFAPSMATRPDQDLGRAAFLCGAARPATSGVFQAKALTLGCA